MPDPSLPYTTTPIQPPNFERTFSDRFSRPLAGTVTLTALGSYPVTLPVELDGTGRMTASLQPGDYKLQGRLTTVDEEIVYILDTITIIK